MAQYTTVSSVFQYALTGDAYVDSLLYADSDYRYAWSTQAGGKYAISYSFPWTTMATALFVNNYGTEPTSAVHYGVSNAIQNEIAQAFDLWANVANIAFTEVNETAGGEVGDIRIAFSSDAGGGTWGYANLWSFGGHNGHGDIWINPDVEADPWAQGNYNFSAILHEIGHALGLEHSFEGNVMPAGFDNSRYTIMSYTDPANVWFYNAETASFEYLLKTPMVYDIAAVQHIYGANMTYRTGNDTYAFAEDEPFFMAIWDAGGTDTIDLSDFTNGCTVNLRSGSYSTLGFSNHSVVNNLGIAFDCFIENATGGAGGDTLLGNALANVLIGNGGADTLNGGGGNDTLFGGTGNDTLIGGAGIDTVDYAAAAAAITVDLVAATAGTTGGGDAAGIGADTLQSLENIIGGNSGDVLTGNGIANRLDGLGGADTLVGGNGDDTLLGGGGNDTMLGGSNNDTLIGNAGDDRLQGGTGNDTLTGHSGIDTLFGNEGNDNLDGDIGADVLWGGTGSDCFIFDDGDFGTMTQSDADRIGDFVRAEGDRVDLALVDANTGTGADDAFTFIGTAAFGNVAGQLRYEVISGNTYLMGDTNGTGGADFWIRLNGNVALAQADLVL